MRTAQLPCEHWIARQRPSGVPEAGALLERRTADVGLRRDWHEVRVARAEVLEIIYVAFANVTVHFAALLSALVDETDAVDRIVPWKERKTF